jgi:ATP-dependent Lon protease
LISVGKTEHKILGVVLTRSETSEEATAEDFYPVGTACRVHRVNEDEGKLQVLVECLQRFRIDRIVKGKAPFSARTTRPGSPTSPPA